MKPEHYEAEIAQWKAKCQAYIDIHDAVVADADRLYKKLRERNQLVRDINNLLLIQHEAAAGRHNYFLVAANLIQAEFGEKE